MVRPPIYTGAVLRKSAAQSVALPTAAPDEAYVRMMRSRLPRAVVSTCPSGRAWLVNHLWMRREPCWSYG